MSQTPRAHRPRIIFRPTSCRICRDEMGYLALASEAVRILSMAAILLFNLPHDTPTHPPPLGGPCLVPFRAARTSSGSNLTYFPTRIWGIPS